MEEVPMDEEMLMDLTGAAEEDTAQAAQLDAQVQEHSATETNRDAMKLLTELNETEELADHYYQNSDYDSMAELVAYIKNLYEMAKNLDQFKLAHHQEIDKQNTMLQNLTKHLHEAEFEKGKHALEDLAQKCLDKVSRYTNLVADQLQTGESGKIKPSPDKQKRPTAQLGTRVVEDVSLVDQNVLTENIRKHLRNYLFTHAERNQGYFLQKVREGPVKFAKWIYERVLVDWVLGDQLRYPEHVLHNVKSTRIIGRDELEQLLDMINYTATDELEKKRPYANRCMMAMWGMFPKKKKGIAAIPTPEAAKMDKRLNLAEEPVGPPIPTPAKPRMIKSFPTPDPDKDDAKEEPTPEYPELVELLRKADDGFTTSEMLKDSGYSSGNKLRGHLEKLRKAGWLQREKKPRGKNNRDVWVYYVNADKFVDDTASSYYPAREREYAPDPSKGFVRDEPEALPEKGQQVLDLEPKGMMRKDGREVIDLPDEKASEVSQTKPVIKPEPASSPVIAAAPPPAVPAPVKQNILFPAEDDESEAPEVRVLGGGDRSRERARKKSPPPPPPRKKSPPPPPPPAPKERSILGRMMDFAGDVRSRLASTMGFANTEEDGVSHHSQSDWSVNDDTEKFEDDEKSPLTQRREEAIKKFVENYKGPRVGGTEIQKLFESNEWKKYYEYNDHLNRIQPVLNYGYNRLEEKKHYRFSRRGRSTQPRFQEHVRLQYHPETHLRKRALQASKQYDDFRRVHERSQQTQVGEYISLNILPAMLYITIRKGVQIAALKILCERLAAHCQGQPTRILLKHSPKSGKFTYTPWLSAKVLESLDAHGLLVRFINRSKDRTKTLQIIVRQNIATGKIQELWESKRTLL